MKKIKFKLKKEDFSKNGILKKSAILTYMQNAAIEDAEQYGASHDNLLKDNMFFAVYRNILKINRKVEPDTEIALITFQSSHDRMRFMRSYFMYISGTEPEITDNFDPYENAIVYCNSIWILMDTQKRTLLRAEALKYPICEHTLPFERPFKVLINNENLNKNGEFKGGDYYIDNNGHVNNAVYADIVDDFSKTGEDVCYFDLTYEREIFENETVEVFSDITENSEKLIGIRKSDSAVCFCSEIKR